MAISIQDSIAGEEMPEIATRIMCAAIDLFGRKGYTATSVREIVQSADVTNPMLYYYFESKEGLFHKTIEYLLRRRSESLREVLEDEEITFAQTLRRIVDFHLDSICDSPEILTFFYAFVFGPRESRPDYEIRESVEEVNQMIAAFFERAVEDGVFEPAEHASDSYELAESLLGQISFHLMRALKELEDARDDEERQELLVRHTGEAARDRLLRFYLNGAGSHLK